MTKKNATEQINEQSIQLDEWTSLEIIQFMNQEDGKIAMAVKQALPIIAKAVDAIVDKWKNGGRCFVVGAGTSGRLGMVDAVELVPTFSIEENRWIGLVAGGKDAMVRSLEETEDDEKEIIAELERHSFGASDIMIGVTASGSTPFVLAAIQYAKKKSALTIGISNNYDTPLSASCDYGIEAETKAEIIRGSTRLKAGTAQKMILNMLSTATMVRLGKVYQNEMVDMKLINKKLVQRAVQTIKNITDISETMAFEALQENDFDLKSALFTILTDGTTKEAASYLAQADGHLKAAIQAYLKKDL